MSRRLAMTMALLFVLGATGSAGCARPGAPTLTIPLSIDDVTPAPDAPIPDIPHELPPPEATGAAERAFLVREVVGPLLSFSLAQEAVIATERQRAAALVAKVEAANRPPKRPWWRFWR